MLKTVNITKTYKNGDSLLYAVNNVSLEINDSEFAVILGPSGSGKSTLLNLTSGLDKPDSGNIFYNETDIATLDETALTAFRKANTAFVFQQYYLLPALTVYENVKMGAELAGVKDFSEILERLGLADKQKKYPYQISGGEQQRVSIARALAKSPKYLFCDEPTGALDEETGRMIMTYLTELRKEKGFTLVMVTHNANFADLATTVIRMHSGKIADVTHNTSPKEVSEIGW